MKNIVLTGLRGSGKTKLGKLISKKLKWDFIDLDKEIEKKAEETIPEIVKKNGWEYFRKLEAEECKNTSNLNNTVIATGGGAIINPENQKYLEKNNVIIYLHRLPKECMKFIKDFTSRPSLTNSSSQLEEMQKIYKERHPIYKKTSNITFDRTNSLENDVKKITLLTKNIY